MSALTVTFVQADGVERVLESTKPGQTLMELGRDNNVVGIYADCGGQCNCATCHVYIDEAWRDVVGPPNDLEAETLDLAPDVQEGASRLACQIALRPELDGLKVTVVMS